MHCDHCGFACGPGKGEHMKYSTWKRTLKFLENYHGTDYISLGGGEPTLHPRFWHILMDSICVTEPHGTWLATNGGVTERAVRLAKLAERGIIGCALSQDEFHDEIDEEVLHAFDVYGWETHGRKNTYFWDNMDYREIRCSSGKISAIGRAAETGVYTYPEEENHFCCGQMIQPNGDIVMCACDNAPVLGNVYRGYDPEWKDLGDWVDCYREFLLEES